jgi:hypothetical protein
MGDADATVCPTASVGYYRFLKMIFKIKNRFLPFHPIPLVAMSRASLRTASTVHGKGFQRGKRSFSSLRP